MNISFQYILQYMTLSYKYALTERERERRVVFILLNGESPRVTLCFKLMKTSMYIVLNYIYCWYSIHYFIFQTPSIGDLSEPVCSMEIDCMVAPQFRSVNIK